jgi:Arc/MetJ family transcription regulator
MQKYRNGNSDIVAFDIGPGSITLEFAGGERYLYTDESVGSETISTMSVLAKAGSGLTAFMETDLRGRYSRRSGGIASECASTPEASKSTAMTQVLVDSKLIEKAIKESGMETSREVVEYGLQTVIRLQAQEELLKMAGTVDWDGAECNEN